jgi:H+/gluconate symporter-like permease
MLSIVVVCALLTYGGVSLFVVVFAVYPFAAELFRQSNIPKRLIPGTIALGAFTFTMDALPGTPQIQNIIPTSFFGTNTWAAPWLGVVGASLHPRLGLSLSRMAAARGAGGRRRLWHGPVQRTGTFPANNCAHPLFAILPLVLVGVSATSCSPAGSPKLYGQATASIRR